MYITVDGLSTRVTERRLKAMAATSSGALDIERIERAINDASTEIDAYLVRFRRPLSTVPDTIVRLAADMSWYYLHNEVIPAHVQARYDNALATLARVRDGKIDLGLDEQGGSPQTAQTAQMTSGGRVWDRDRSKGFI